MTDQPELPLDIALRWAFLQRRIREVGGVPLCYLDLDGSVVYAISRWGLIREFCDLGDLARHLDRMEGHTP